MIAESEFGDSSISLLYPTVLFRQRDEIFKSLGNLASLFPYFLGKTNEEK